MQQRSPALASLIAGALFILSASAWSQSSTFAEPQARVVRAAPGQALARAAQASRRAAVQESLRNRGASDATAGSLVEVDGGVSKFDRTHVRLQQQVAGQVVYGTSVKATFNERGELVHLIEKVAPVPSTAPTPASIDERQALDAAMALVHPDVRAGFQPGPRAGQTLRFRGGSFFHEDPSVTRVLVPQPDGSLAQGFLVETWTQRANLLDHTLVGGDGTVLAVERRTASDTYNVFTVDPSKTPQTAVAGPGAGNVESPSGWLGSGAQTTININGNNASAYLDVDSNNVPDAGGSAVTVGDFLAAADLGQSPSGTTNRAVAVQNLFYLNNVIHDVLYRHGFNEAAGNFQIDNFGKGGAGGDPVNAEAQDGGGTDNANFATPKDGARPRMQMYLWTGAGATHEVVVGSTLYAAMGAEFGPALSTTGLSGQIVPAVDGVGTIGDGCEALTTNVSGKIALVDRGNCDFVVKAKNAQTAGAIALIVANNADTAIFTMGGTTKVRIPAVMVSRADGAALRSKAPPVNGTMRRKAIQPLQIDGDLDSDIVFHEYGHGLTWRMIGGMSGPLAGAIGEGASDVVAFMVNGNDVMAEYAFSNPNGIRRYPYAGYPLTYADVKGAEVHDDGEIYAAAMWRLRELWVKSKRSNDALFDHFVDGMNYTPPTPAYEQMRDGMLDAIAATAGSDAIARCALVWKAFAQFGIGDGATGVVSRRGAVSITPSTSTRADCSH
ncbi:MAG TPA: M36 family metallopeptidase [Caldimonas sp.]|nr:M36 family metallopeptidase [Caldimonas sp.]